MLGLGRVDAYVANELSVGELDGIAVYDVGDAGDFCSKADGGHEKQAKKNSYISEKSRHSFFKEGLLKHVFIEVALIMSPSSPWRLFASPLGS